MNLLQIGLSEKQFEYPSGSLVLTDEPILKRGAKLYDPAKHGLNPLPLQAREAREFAAVLFPDKDLMTYRNGRRARILAIGTVDPGADLAAVRAILPTEVRETVKLYLDGKIDQWYSLQERPGVAFILNVTDLAAAHEMLEKLPLGQAHLMSFELIPLGPLNPLRQLQGMTTGSPNR